MFGNQNMKDMMSKLQVMKGAVEDSKKDIYRLKPFKDYQINSVGKTKNIIETLIKTLVVRLMMQVCFPYFLSIG